MIPAPVGDFFDNRTPGHKAAVREVQRLQAENDRLRSELARVRVERDAACAAIVIEAKCLGDCDELKAAEMARVYLESIACPNECARLAAMVWTERDGGG